MNRIEQNGTDRIESSWIGTNRAKVFLFDFLFVSFTFFSLLEFFIFISSTKRKKRNKFFGSCFAVFFIILCLLTHQIHYCFYSVLLELVAIPVIEKDKEKNNNNYDSKKKTVSRIKHLREKNKTNFCLTTQLLYEATDNHHVCICKRDDNSVNSKITEHNQKIKCNEKNK